MLGAEPAFVNREYVLGSEGAAGDDSDGLDFDIAIDLINAGLKRQLLPAF